LLNDAWLFGEGQTDAVFKTASVYVEKAFLDLYHG